MIKQITSISSSSNPKFKFLENLEKSRNRRVLGLTAFEGVKELEMALSGGIQFHSLFYVPAVADKKLIESIVELNPETELYQIDEKLFAKSAYRESSGGIIAIVKTPVRALEALSLSRNPLILVLEGIEKPGNLGAIFRTADAAAVDAVICCDLPGDLYNPNTIRASLGTIFTVPTVVCSAEQTRNWLKQNEFKTFCSNLHQATDYHIENYTGSSAIIMGTEATGVTDSWISFADKNVKIPMLGKIDSMNVSVATAILVYEARRQRLLQS